MSENADGAPVTEFTDADLTGARFRKTQLNGARFRMVDLSGAVLRDVSLAGVTVDGSEIDGLLIDGVEVAPLVQAELTRRDPARAWRDASDPAALSRAWAVLEQSWAGTYERVAALPPGSADLSVDQEWSFAQTLRHLVFATDGWLGAVRGDEQPFHPLGVPFTELDEFIDGSVAELGVDLDASPSYAEVLELRADRAARVRDYLAGVSAERLAEEVEGPLWEAGRRLSVMRCLRVIFNEECEHRRFAERDLDLIEAGSELVGPARPLQAPG